MKTILLAIPVCTIISIQSVFARFVLESGRYGFEHSIISLRERKYAGIISMKPWYGSIAS